jgi:hypothetical protein
MYNAHTTKSIWLHVVTLRQWTPKFNWYMRRLVVENIHSKDTCHDDIGLCAQCIGIIVGSMVSTIWEGLCGRS